MGALGIYWDINGRLMGYLYIYIIKLQQWDKSYSTIFGRDKHALPAILL